MDHSRINVFWIAGGDAWHERESMNWLQRFILATLCRGWVKRMRNRLQAAENARRKAEARADRAIGSEVRTYDLITKTLDGIKAPRTERGLRGELITLTPTDRIRSVVGIKKAPPVCPRCREVVSL